MPFKSAMQPGLPPKSGQTPTGSIDPELAFEAGVSIALGCGAIARAGEASQKLSRFTDTSYVLMSSAGVTLQRIPRADIVAELERQARINGNLEHYRLRFRPGRVTVMASLFAGFTVLLSMQGWTNMINDRRIADLEESYLAHQASVQQGSSDSELAAIETIGEFESRVLRTRLDGCYAQVKHNLARAADRLNAAMETRTATDGQVRLVDANGAYEQYLQSRDSCRKSLLGLFPGLPQT